jgi:hypothetical protein
MKAAAQQKSRIMNFGAQLKETKKDTFGLEKLTAPVKYIKINNLFPIIIIIIN